MSNLQTLIIKNENDFSNYFFGQNPNVGSLCCDASEFADVQNQVNILGYNCIVNTTWF